MARKTIRVDIPSSSAEEMVELSLRIIKKHKEMSSDSTLNRFDMDRFEKRTTASQGAYEKGKELHETAEKKIQEGYRGIGIAKGQSSNTPDTNYSDITDIRDELLITHKGNEEALSEYGFNVVVGEAKSPTRKSEGGEEGV